MKKNDIRTLTRLALLVAIDGWSEPSAWAVSL